jgi:hypothetical protein
MPELVLGFYNKINVCFLLTCKVDISYGHVHTLQKRPDRVWLVTSRLGTGKTITFFIVYLHSDITVFFRKYLPVLGLHVCDGRFVGFIPNKLFVNLFCLQS